MTKLAAPGRDRLGAIGIVVAEILGLIAQIALVAIGFEYTYADSDDQIAEVAQLFLWCLIGTIYLLGTVLWLNLDLRVRHQDHALVRNLVGSRIARWISLFLTFSSSFVGLTAAIQLITARGEPDRMVAYEIAAVWAMLVAWSLFHWGFARVYHSKYYGGSGESPLIFPRTPEPRLVDFVYFAFTNGTSFAASDVTVTTSRMRWTVVWHTSFSFFFNALIIVLSMNTIAGGIPDL